MKILFTFFAFYVLNTLVGQNTKTLLFNLPIEQGDSIVKKELLVDTINFSKKEVYRWKDKKYITIPMFYSKSIPDIYSLKPETITHTIEDKMCKPDSSIHKELITFINYFDKSNKKDVEIFYNKLVNYLRVDYDSTTTSFIVGQVTQENKKWKVNETTTYFYHKKGDTCDKISITWFNEGKHMQTIFINYRLN